MPATPQKQMLLCIQKVASRVSQERRMHGPTGRFGDDRHDVYGAGSGTKQVCPGCDTVLIQQVDKAASMNQCPFCGFGFASMTQKAASLRQEILFDAYRAGYTGREPGAPAQEISLEEPKLDLTGIPTFGD